MVVSCELASSPQLDTYRPAMLASCLRFITGGRIMVSRKLAWSLSGKLGDAAKRQTGIDVRRKDAGKRRRASGVRSRDGFRSVRTVVRRVRRPQM